ncbi:MAG TPA: hypothetical protein VMZ28_19055 [Kofleriaceae bacterium]|nr:hypothetical protein [Kofleriaceae bacterium]
MIRWLAVVVAAAVACDAPPVEVHYDLGARCGECGAGRFDGTACVYPSQRIDVDLGPAPADTGDRDVFHTEDYSGPEHARVEKAGADAAAVGGAVVLDRVYEIGTTVELERGVMYTGGGLRRACAAMSIATAPAAAGSRCVTVDSIAGQDRGRFLVNTDPSMEGTLGTFGVTLVDRRGSRLCTGEQGLAFAIPAGARIAPVFPLARTVDGDPARPGVLVDGVLFDGAARCNRATHDWRFDITYALRGVGHTVQRSIFRDTPSENLIACRVDLLDNVAVDLGGSLVHRSCAEPPDDDAVRIEGNYVENANRFTDAVMGHSEGVVTFSANSGDTLALGNTFRGGAEGAFGRLGADDGVVDSVENCYAHLARLITIASPADESAFHSVDDLVIDVGE